MKIVIDTNIVISGVFFGGLPRKVLQAVLTDKITACANIEIIQEYNATVREMISRKQGKIDENILMPLVGRMQIVESKTKIQVCRDPDDNKFIECAKDTHALYIVSGDKDLLDIGTYEEIEILTAKEFCDKYLPTTLPTRPRCLEEMSKAEFDAMMEQGFKDMEAGKFRPAEDVFDELEKEYGF